MSGLWGTSGIQPSHLLQDSGQLGGDTSAGGTVFDASQYAFFGDDVGEEVKLGGLEDEGDIMSSTALEEDKIFYDKEELNKAVSGERVMGTIDDRMSRETESSSNLARVVSSCVHGMHLGAVVCSSEQPPLRPLGSLAGDGASLVLKSVLDRATELLTNPRAATNYALTNRQLWQASFDEFFGLIKYCVNRYDDVMKTLEMQAQANMSVIGSYAARIISREMPVELLHASLPHTDEQQRKHLLDFAQRSVPVDGSNKQDRGNDGQNTSESVASL